MFLCSKKPVTNLGVLKIQSKWRGLPSTCVCVGAWISPSLFSCNSCALLYLIRAPALIVGLNWVWRARETHTHTYTHKHTWDCQLLRQLPQNYGGREKGGKTLSDREGGCQKIKNDFLLRKVFNTNKRENSFNCAQFVINLSFFLLHFPNTPYPLLSPPLSPTFCFAVFTHYAPISTNSPSNSHTLTLCPSAHSQSFNYPAECHWVHPDCCFF